MKKILNGTAVNGPPTGPHNFLALRLEIVTCRRYVGWKGAPRPQRTQKTHTRPFDASPILKNTPITRELENQRTRELENQAANEPGN